MSSDAKPTLPITIGVGSNDGAHHVTVLIDGVPMFLTPAEAKEVARQLVTQAQEALIANAHKAGGFRK